MTAQQFETVAAISTPPGKGGVALIRISGPDAIPIADACFSPRGGKRLADHPARMAVYGDIVGADGRIDDGIALLFRAPHSYTGEDVAELTCHGGRLVTEAVLTAVLSAGAVPAPAGEFTRRAFLNGRLSLTDAEAIGDLLDAQTTAQLRLAGNDARDKLNAAVNGCAEDLLHLLATLFAQIDFPDEDLGSMTTDEILSALNRCDLTLGQLCDRYRTGHAVNEGITTVLCGRPNAGKSSVYNLLAEQELAIVTDVAGTTRDVLETTVSVGPMLLRVFDTAGIHETQDKVERIGVTRARQKMESCELVLAVFDASAPLTSEDRELIGLLDRVEGQVVALLNKSDLPRHPDAEEIAAHFPRCLSISALRAEDRAKLCALLEEMFLDENVTIGEDAIPANARQHAALLRASQAVRCALEAFGGGMPVDAAAAEIEQAIEALREMDGRGLAAELTDHIFHRFCVGK